MIIIDHQISKAKWFFFALLTTALTVCTACTTQTIDIWNVYETGFTHESAIGNEDEFELDVVFTHRRSGETLLRPAFWDGGDSYLVRFAPIRRGIWTWRTECAQDEELSGLQGSFRCKKYKGPLDIYAHGFVTVRPGLKYFTYADGTPFFYLGDTHWGMYTEEIDAPGPNAGDTGAQSHFKYIVDRRVEQGFTVYQSEPIGARFKLADGRIDQVDIAGFRDADRYYQYIADAGLVHANAELFFASEMNEKLIADHVALERLARYWVARFGAYPVMWTLAQEVDNDFYSEIAHQTLYDYSCNPWVEFAGKYTDKQSMRTNNAGSLALPSKPDESDWVLEIIR